MIFSEKHCPTKLLARFVIRVIHQQHPPTNKIPNKGFNTAHLHLEVKLQHISDVLFKWISIEICIFPSSNCLSICPAVPCQKMQHIPSTLSCDGVKGPFQGSGTGSWHIRCPLTPTRVLYCPSQPVWHVSPIESVGVRGQQRSATDHWMNEETFQEKLKCP